MCNLKINVYHGTWFEGTYMDFAKICRFIAYFLMLQPPRHKFLMIELQMNDSVIDWMNFYREVNYKILFYTVHLYLSLCNVCLLNEL